MAVWAIGRCRTPRHRAERHVSTKPTLQFLKRFLSIGWSFPLAHLAITTLLPSSRTVDLHIGSSAAVFTDANIPLIPLDCDRFPGAPPLALAHAGFQLAHNRTSSVVLQAVNDLIKVYNATKVVSVGHSLGGALALLEGLYLRLNLAPNVSVITRTFGQPRVSIGQNQDWEVGHLQLLTKVGDAIFAEFVDEKVRYEYHVQMFVDPEMGLTVDRPGSRYEQTRFRSHFTAACVTSIHTLDDMC